MAEAMYGGFWIRTLAYAADLSIIMLVLLVLAVPFAFAGGAGAALFGLIAAVGPIAYFVLLTASERQATFGKQLCGLKVRQAEAGTRISLLRSIGRELGKIISGAILMIGFLLIAFTGRKQGLHDMLASTEVTRDGQPRIAVAILVALAGVVIPVIAIPLMFAGMFAGLMAMMMGEMETKQAKPVPRVEQKAAPRPQAATAPAPAAAPPAPTPAATPAPQAVADDPEVVYRRFHEAIVARDVAEMRKWSAAKLGAVIDAGSAVENKMAIAMAAGTMPKTYSVAGTELSPDGASATLRLAPGGTQGGEKLSGTAKLVKEGGGWKVLSYEWTQEWSMGSKPAVATPKPAAAEPVKPAEAPQPPKPAAASAPAAVPAPPAAPAPQPKAAPRRSESTAGKPAAPTLQQAKPACVYKPVMTDEDIARCR